MDKKWEQIQQALCAQIRGEEPHPVVSQRTLFGIPSSVEVQMAKFAAEVAHERAQRAQTSGEDTPVETVEDTSDEAGEASSPEQDEMDLRLLVALRAAELGSAAQVGRGMRYFIEAGRAAGFDIPAYPYDPKGDLRAFLRSVGATNLPEYYETLGIDQDHYEDVQTHALIVLREEGKERAYLVRGAEFCEAARFVPLAQSSILAMCDEKTLRAIAEIIGVEEKRPCEQVF